tara:strand:- start:93 stop:311 length:219 start_codon:yes stop_codon:yes gene_type:complete
MKDSNYTPVENNPSLVRDKSSDAIININESAYKARLLEIEKSKKESQQTEKINKLESDVEEIKNLLKQLVSK